MIGIKKMVGLNFYIWFVLCVSPSVQIHTLPPFVISYTSLDFLLFAMIGYRTFRHILLMFAFNFVNITFDETKFMFMFVIKILTI